MPNEDWLTKAVAWQPLAVSARRHFPHSMSVVSAFTSPGIGYTHRSNLMVMPSFEIFEPEAGDSPIVVEVPHAGLGLTLGRDPERFPQVAAFACKVVARLVNHGTTRAQRPGGVT